MKKALLFLAMAMGISHGQAITWSKTIGNEGTILLKAVRVDPEGNTLAFGTFRPTYPLESGPRKGYGSGADVFLHKMDRQGRTLWFRNLSGGGDNRSIDIDLDPAGNAYVLCELSPEYPIGPGRMVLSGDADTLRLKNSRGDYKVFCKFRPDGTPAWCRQGADNNSPKHQQIRVVNGKVMVSGYFTSWAKYVGVADSLYTGGKTKAFLSEWDTDGKLLSMAAVDSMEEARFVRPDGQGGLCLGFLKDLGGKEYIERRDPAGKSLWIRPLLDRGTSSALITDLLPDGAGNIYVVGQFNYQATFSMGNGRDTTVGWDRVANYFLMKLGPDGKGIWIRSETGGFHTPSNLVLGKDGSIHFWTAIDGRILRFDPEGREIWNVPMSGGRNSEYTSSLALDPVSGAPVLGTSFTSRMVILGKEFRAEGIENILLLRVEPVAIGTRREESMLRDLPGRTTPWWNHFSLDGRIRTLSQP